MDATYRPLVALIIFMLMLLWEYYQPLQTLTQQRLARWLANLSLAMLGVMVVNVAVVGGVVLSAQYGVDNGIGLFNYLTMFSALPNWAHFIMSFLILDMLIYWQHVLSHKWRWLWQLHKVHHSDINLDVSTAVRFHPLEIALSAIYKVVIIMLLGLNVSAVLVFEMVLNGAAIFNHANVKLPKYLDDKLSLWLITPSIHHIHHSIIKRETDSNFGFSITLWDRIFGSYNQRSKQEQQTMTLGLAEYRQGSKLTLINLLLMPFKR